MKINPQFYASAKPMIQYGPQVIEQNIIAYTKRCLPIKKSKETKHSGFKEEENEVYYVEQAKRFNGPGKIINKTL